MFLKFKIAIPFLIFKSISSLYFPFLVAHGLAIKLANGLA